MWEKKTELTQKGCNSNYIFISIFCDSGIYILYRILLIYTEITFVLSLPVRQDNICHMNF